MKAIITGNISAAKEDLLHRESPDVAWWGDARLRGVVDGVEVVIVPIDGIDRLRGVALESYELHPTASGHRKFKEAVAIAESRVRSIESKEGE